MTPTDGNQRSLIAVMESRLPAKPDCPIFSFLDSRGDVTESITRLALFDAARSVASCLQRSRLQKRPVILLYPHGLEFIVALLGAILAGSWPVPLSKSRGRNWQAISNVIKRSGAGALLTTRSRRSVLPEGLIKQNKLTLICTDEVPDEPRQWRRAPVASDDTAFIQYTSGSTALPKGVVITHRNLLHNSELIRRSFGCRSLDIGIGWLPFHHDMGLIGHIIQPLYSGMHNYFLSPTAFVARPLRWLQAISRYRGTISGGPGFGYALCNEKIDEKSGELNLDLRSWRLAYCGSERISSSVAKTFASRFGSSGFSAEAFYPCYGLAESTLFVCGRRGVKTSTPSGCEQSYVSVGEPGLNGELSIRHPDTQKAVAEGVIGEICCSSPSVAAGYYRDPVTTAHCFRATPGIAKGSPRLSWLRTGDLGFLKENNLYFVGRLKNLFKRRGRSFHAEDIEERIREMTADKNVGRCASFSLDRDDEGPIVVLIEKGHELQATQGEALLSCVKAELCHDMGLVIDQIFLVPHNSLPLTTSGKLARQDCKRLFLEFGPARQGGCVGDKRKEDT